MMFRALERCDNIEEMITIRKTFKEDIYDSGRDKEHIAKKSRYL